MTARLIKEFEQTDPNTLEDLLMIMARNIEDSLIQSGAKPGKDFSFLDIYKLAQPFALEVFKKNDKITYATTWPVIKD